MFSYEPSSLGATKVVHCAVNRTQPCDIILSKTVTSCCHDLSGTKTTEFLSKYLCLISLFTKLACLGQPQLNKKFVNTIFRMFRREELLLFATPNSGSGD